MKQDSIFKIPEEHDLESQVRKEREWRFLRNARVRKQAQKIIQKGISRLDDQIFLNRNPGMPSVVKFHPFTPCIAVADKDCICFWDWEKGEKLDYFHNGNPRYTRITAMEYLNGQDCSLLLTATDDGAIRVWKNFADLEKNPEMVTAWQGLSDMLPTTRGRAKWQQETPHEASKSRRPMLGYIMSAELLSNTVIARGLIGALTALVSELVYLSSQALTIA
uniref:Uncharacterized protein n=1 Tax=Sphaerodactylus townsendi TaxID=933632 RepID=A0ACB8EKE6_9SAUR